MELIRGSHNLHPRHRGCVATIGNFDGVHVGHRAVLDRLGAAAARFRLPATVVTFEPHPREYFTPDSAPARITGLRDKVWLLAELGVARVLCLPFGPKLAAMEAEAFIDELLVNRLGVRYLLVGDDFRFGRGRRGDHAMLETAGARHGFELARIPTVDLDGERVSSTRVRSALSSGELEAAARLLGRPYRVCGRVVRGDALGRPLGWPTANIRIGRGRPSVAGIYVTEVHGLGKPWPAAASVGTRPTVNGHDTRVEVHLLDFEGELYGRHLEVAFLAHLRPEARFDSLEALSAQIGRDVDRTRDWFANRGARSAGDDPRKTQ